MHNRLRKYRVKLGLTQEYVSKILGVSRTTITAIESGERKVSTDELKKLSEIYGVNTELILYGYSSEASDINMFARTFSELSENDRKEIINLIEFKKRLKA